MVSCWWASVDHANTATSLGVVFFFWVVGMVSRRVNPDKAVLGESVLVGCVSARIIVGPMQV